MSHHTLHAGLRITLLLGLGLGIVCGTLAAPLETSLPPEMPPGLLSLMGALRQKAAPLERQLAQALQKEDFAQAEKLCRQLTNDLPYYSHGFYNLGCLRSRAGLTHEAFALLEAAVERGFNDALHIERDPDWENLRPDPRFKAILERARRTRPLIAWYRPTPAVPSNGVAWVSDANTAAAQSGLFRAEFKLNPAAVTNLPITQWKHEAGDLLRQWWAAGTAAGNGGDLYDNRDGDHSNLPRELFPQLTYVEYAPEAKALELHWGIAAHLMLQGGVVIGNASVASVMGPFWRSMTRAAYTSPGPLSLLPAQYFANQIYFYPSHRDYQPGHNGKLPDGREGGYGDVFPANTPYVITSLGSSGSDQPFLQAVAATLAAFQPEVKQGLTTRGLIAPTIQYLLRRSLNNVNSREDYLSGKAHPPVFDAKHLDPKRMVTLAHELRPESLPPVVILRVEKEDKPLPNRDFFEPVDSEELFTTVAAIARVMRSTQLRRAMLVNASGSRDVSQRPLRFHWVLLQGDPRKVRLRTFDAQGSRAEIQVDWHPRFPIAGPPGMAANRVDVGVFADNGVHLSAPAFITWYCPDNQERVYDEQGRIRSITYTGEFEPGNYADPMVVSARSWRDEYHYDNSGKLTGWTRWRGGISEDFNANGELIIKKDASGLPLETRRVRYTLRPRPNLPPALEQQILDPAAPATPLTNTTSRPLLNAPIAP
ncbi:hypothetical protein NXS98_13500 [Fontisphaera persica]|uniref:tetratricopeptide repeat protein n=1 Tax=Fontisphaera persica TaxID=2974023 RepID=UPI0024C03B7B|nr:hypothetical protein [Fontisphaera persica]WCJ58725.1 hypothetical protein NXS98_13500 [Fontisphaera persica]